MLGRHICLTRSRHFAIYKRIRTHNWHLTINIKGLYEPTRESIEGFVLTWLKSNILQDVCVGGGGGGGGGVQYGDVYCWVAGLAPSCNGSNVNFTYSRVIRKSSIYLMLSENFQ